MKKSLFVVLFMFWIFHFSLATDVWQELESSPIIKKQTSAAVLDRFNSWKMWLIWDLYENTDYWSITASVNNDESKSRLENVNIELKNISKNFEELKSQKQRTDTQYNELKQTIAGLIASSNKINDNIKLRVITIWQYERKIQSTRDKLDVLKKDLDQSIESLNNYTRILYKVKNDFYSNDLKIDDLKLFVGSDNIATSLSNEELYKSLSLKIKDLMETLTIKQQDYDNTIVELQNSIDKHKNELTQYNLEIQYLAEQKSQLDKLMEYFKSDKEITDKKYIELVNSQSDLEKQKQALKEEIAKNPTQVINYTDWLDLKSLANDNEQPDWDRFFSWPLNIPPKINTLFRDSSYKAMFGSDHVALDLKAPMFSVVYAPANWVVYQVTDQTWPWLNWVLMAHKYWYITEYIHLYDVFVKKWQYVRRWQPIALSSWAPWARGSGPMTTGPHLHWWVIKDMNPIDPLKVTDLSIFNAQDVPDYMSAKYQKDRGSRLSQTYDMSKVRIMPWASVDDRRQAFLQTYAWSAFSNLSIWKSAAKANNVDVDFWICIAFAESSLWKNLSSDYNLWNVWNNDRWDRINLSWPEQWINAIYSVLNNKNLWWYLTMDKLSRWWNKEWMIYASSDWDWQKNINKCLKSIKWYEVAPNFFFRTWDSDE